MSSKPDDKAPAEAAAAVELQPVAATPAAADPVAAAVEEGQAPAAAAAVAPSTSAEVIVASPTGFSKDFKRTNLTIAYRDVSMVVRVPVGDQGIKTLITPLVNLGRAITSGGKSLEKKDFFRVHGASGVLKPGRMTLVLAPPGHGKSSFLKVLASRLPASAGTITYNGRTADEAHAEGCNTRRLTQFVDQVDDHLPLLTVQETLDFAHQVTSAVYDKQRVTDTIELLGLEECKDTILGNALIRGVSGGQKRRVTLGEMLVGDACALFLDEYTNGLDTATSEDITRGLSQWVKRTNGMMVATLQQPTPGLYAAFEDVVLLRDSQVVFHGPREDVLPYFSSMGFNCPDDVDVCDFLNDCLSQPRVALDRLRDTEQREAKHRAKHGKPAVAHPTTWTLSAGGQLHKSEMPCVTTAQMAAHYAATPMRAAMMAELDAILPAERVALPKPKTPEGAEAVKALEPLMPSPETQHMYQTGYTMPLLTLMSIVLGRQMLMFKRNQQQIFPRLFQCLFMGLLYGSLYFQIGTEDFFLRVAVLLICLTTVAFTNMIELASSVEANKIVYKQAGAKFYPTYTYVIAAAICSVPLFVAESALFSVLLYFMSNCVMQAGHFFIFYAILLCCSFCMSVWFRMLSALGDDEASAHAIAGPSSGIFTVFGGFFVTLNNLPVFMQWLFWLSPFSWAVRALCNNEFLSSRYSEITDEGITLGELYLSTVDMKTGNEWIGYGVLYLLGFSLMCMVLHSIFLNKPHFESSKGTTRFDDEPEMLDSDFDKEINAAVEAEAEAVDNGVEPELPVGLEGALSAASGVGRGSFVGGSNANSSFVRDATSFGANPNALKTLREALPFTPTWLSFSNIKYTVKVTSQKGVKSDRVLLAGIDGYAEPGKLTALMGASGAGKTTLLDVLAGRKNMGVIEGKILFNGHAPTPTEMSIVTGYVEQFDSLMAYDTVKETLLFAAQLRLPAEVSFEVKETIVREIMDILELTSIQDFIIGNPRIPGLSPSQLKRVNIGCELVANPSILFLDEPTTGLDSKAAQTVMRVVRRIARSGRAVICTIHQPSAELFYLFDRLVLLASGGHQIYFGDLGTRSKKFVQYMQAIEKVKPCPPRYNPASWMLEELGVGVSGQKGEEAEPSSVKVERFRAAYLDSAVKTKVLSKIAALEAIGELQAQAEADAAAAAENNNENAANESEPAPAVERIDVAPAPQVVAPTGARTAGGNNKQASESDAEHPQLGLESAPSFGGERRHSFSALSHTSAALPTAASKIVVRNAPHWTLQLWLLQMRALRSYWRNPPFMMSRFVVLIVLSVVFGLIYFQMDVNNQAAAVSFVAALTVCATFGAVVHATTSLPAKMNNRAVFYREISSGMYMPALWAVAGLLVDILWCIPSSFLLQIPVYFLIGLDNTADKFFKYYLATYASALLFSSVAALFAAISNNAQTATILQGLFFSFAFTFSGVAITLPKIPIGYVWLFRMLPVSHVTEALAMPQFQTCTPLPQCSPLIEITEGTKTVWKPMAEFMSDYLGFTLKEEGYWHAIGWLVLIIAVINIFAFLGTQKCRFSSR